MSGFDGPTATELPALLFPRRKFDPSKMGTPERLEFERENRVARTRMAELRAETMRRRPEWWSA